jgi:hypothetical protein
LLLVSVVLCGAVGCIGSEDCERNRESPACDNTEEQPPEPPAAQLPEIVSTHQSLEQPREGVFSFRVEARDLRNSPLRFSWTHSSGTFASPQTDTLASSEIQWIAPPCTQKVEPPVVTVTVTNERGLAVLTHFKIAYAMYCTGWSKGGRLSLARTGHTVSLLNSGRVLVTGGLGIQGYVSGSELLDPEEDSTTLSGTLRTPRVMHIATVLGSGQVLVSGGFNEAGALKAAELYNPATAQWLPTADMTMPRALHAATPLSPFRVLVTGGTGPIGSVSSAELYDYDPRSETGTWSPVPGMSVARQSHTAVLLPAGMVLVAGGAHEGRATASAEIFDPQERVWRAATNMTTARESHTATVLPSGKVLVVGGVNGSTFHASAELYDPLTNTWSPAGTMSSPRVYHTATLLPSGKVLVLGGRDAERTLGSAEVYDPASGTWSAAEAMETPRLRHAATLMPSGRLLVTGGFSVSRFLDSIEVSNLEVEAVLQ